MARSDYVQVSLIHDIIIMSQRLELNSPYYGSSLVYMFISGDYDFVRCYMETNLGKNRATVM